ncbi:MAG: hypothetical protein GQ522_03150, partial [Deltaproteobacteria bacterium]|nr:hypothetical protein [Deltaproteobacteria bacterium]
MTTNQNRQPGRTYPPLLTLSLLLLLALSACSNAVREQLEKDPPVVELEEETEEVSATRDGILVIGRACAVSWRCIAEGPGDWLFVELLKLPALAGGKQEGIPIERLERAVGRAVRSLARKRRYASLSRREQAEMVADTIADEYRTKLLSTVPEALREMNAREQGRYGPETEGHISISSLTIDVLDSWPKGPTYRLELKVAFKKGDPTHLRIMCDDCNSLPAGSERWTPYEFWNPVVLVGGEGQLTICLEARAEPYYGNYSNTDIACATMDIPPSKEQREKGEPDIAEVNMSGQRCFGAIGNNCGGVEAGELEYGDYCARHDPISEPDLATCFINGGSWEYDECCVANRVGGNAPESKQGSCSPVIAKLLDQPLICRSEREKVAERQLMGLTWVREIDPTLKDKVGKVSFEEYCAPSGATVHWDEVP